MLVSWRVCLKFGGPQIHCFQLGNQACHFMLNSRGILAAVIRLDLFHGNVMMFDSNFRKVQSSVF